MNKKRLIKTISKDAWQHGSNKAVLLDDVIKAINAAPNVGMTPEAKQRIRDMLHESLWGYMLDGQIDDLLENIFNAMPEESDNDIARRKWEKYQEYRDDWMKKMRAGKKDNEDEWRPMPWLDWLDKGGE